MRKLLFILFCLISLISKGQVYQEMPQYGYRANRMSFDSTLSIPTTCGVPTLKSNVIKKAAIAFDSCNNKFYKYNPKTATWGEIGGIDTTSLSNRINGKADTSALNLKLNISDTTNKWVNNIYRKNGKDSIFYKIGSTEYGIKDSTGGVQNGRFGNDTAIILMAKIHNDAGVQLTNGQVIRWGSSGTNSDVPSVRLANNKHDSTSANTLGFVKGTINANDTGWAILSGKIEKLNTSAFSNGDIIYLDSTNGNWTKNKPVAPYHMVYLGVVIKANAGNGSIFVKCQNGYELDEIHDVLITSKVNNQILAYSDTQKVWKNRNIYSVVDTSSTIATKSNVANKVNISDTASMLTNYQKSATAMKYTDTASMLSPYAKTSAVNLKVNISDTSSMLSNYAKTSAVNLKVNISDTANMLTGYTRKTRSISTTAPLSGGGDLSADRTLSIAQATTSTNGYLSSTDWNTFNNKGYALTIGCTLTAFAASTTYFFGISSSGTNGTGGIRRVYIPKAGTITGGYIYMRTTGSTSSENWTLTIRLNNTSNTTFATVGNTSQDKLFSASGLSISVVAGDYIEITTTTPAWSSTTGNTVIYGSILIQ